MTPNEYVKLALVTESDNFSNQSLIGKITMSLFQWAHKGSLAERMAQKRSIRLNHAYIGIATEMEELLTALDKPGDLDRVNVMEEVADCLWYCALAVDELGIDLDKFLPRLLFTQNILTEQQTRAKIESQVRESIKDSGRLLDLVKKGTFYGKPLNEEAIQKNMSELLVHLTVTCHTAGFSIEEAMKRNIKKLAKRYQGKFSSHFAFNRNLDLEREILEGLSH